MKKEIIKSFDLEAYKNGAKIKTRDGHEVRIICTDTRGLYPIVALISLCDGSEISQSYTSKGKKQLTKDVISDDDLVIVEEVEEPEFWSEDVNIFIDGYYISDNSEIYATEHQPNDIDSYNVFATEKLAKSALAMARISQIMANDVEHFGGVITDEEWEDDEWKYVIHRLGDCIDTTATKYNYYFLAFHTEAQRDLFLEKYHDLVKDYLMID